MTEGFQRWPRAKEAESRVMVGAIKVGCSRKARALVLAGSLVVEILSFADLLLLTGTTPVPSRFTFYVRQLEGARGGLRMYFDLNVPYIANHGELQRTLAFLTELGFNTVALDFTISGKVPAEISSQIPNPLPFTVPKSLHILRRCTLHLSDPSQNHRLQALSSAYDVLAIRPTNEKSLQQACQALECDLISLDLSTRFPFYFKHTTMANALQRGVKFEICYGPGILNSDGGASRRNLISNATQLIRATRGRGIIISSEAKRALACRGPADVVNLAVLWGLGQEKGMEAVGKEARSVVVQSEMKRRSYRGVIDVIYGGEKPDRAPEKPTKGKRKAEVSKENEAGRVNAMPTPISKREQKRQAKKARIDTVKGSENKPKEASKGSAVSPDDAPAADSQKVKGT